MNNLLRFRVNKNKSAFSINKKIVSFIQKFSTTNKDLQVLVKEIIKNIDLPKDVVEKKINQILYLRFNYKENKFVNFESKKIIKDFFIYIGLNFINILGHLLVNFNNTKKKEYDLICDNVFNQLSVSRYSRLIKKFNKVCLIGTKSYKKKVKKEDYFKYKKFLIGISSLKLKQKTFFLFLGFKILYISLKKKINLFKVFNILTYEIFKSSHIFSKIKGKFYLTNKFYGTSPIFNYYFKKSGGKITSCTQKNILSQSLSLFVYTDIMFTLGKGQGKICNQLGGDIKKFIPVGSLFMEDSWYKKKKDFKNVPKADILILGVNTLYNTRHYVNNNYKKDYYGAYLNWLKNLSKDFPSKKIILKYHNDYTIDPQEQKKLEKTKIDFLIKNTSINSSYANAYRSKIVLSFSSTMIVELLGNNKLAYFLDPGLRGDQWFRDIKNLKKYRIGTYKKLKQIINQKKRTSINFKSYFCKDSKYTSDLIFKNLRKTKNKIFTK